MKYFNTLSFFVGEKKATFKTKVALKRRVMQKLDHFNKNKIIS